MVRINGLFHLLINEVYIGIINNPLILTFDPNFQQDIQIRDPPAGILGAVASHPSEVPKEWWVREEVAEAVHNGIPHVDQLST